MNRMGEWVKWAVWLASLGCGIGLSYGALSTRMSACESSIAGILRESESNKLLLLDIRERTIRMEVKMDTVKEDLARWRVKAESIR